MNWLIFNIRHMYKKQLLNKLFKRHVLNNNTIRKDIEYNVLVRGCSVNPNTIQKKFHHLMIYYPDFALVFFWRTNHNHKWRHWFATDTSCKFFKSTKIGGGFVCYHPLGTVINAKVIGENFQCRNGLTIGNKGNDNKLIPTIGDNVTVGANVVIIGPITIGDNVVIGAGSVVIKDVPSDCVIAGNPAKIIK